MAVKDWSDGDLLTPLAMNDLTSQMYMRFANVAARDAFLVGDYAPTAGMSVFMMDTNMTLVYTSVGGNNYWAPLPGTLCFYAQQVNAQSVSLNAITGYTLANHGNRNYGNWFDAASGKFTPAVPGIYEFTGGVSLTTSASGAGSHRVGFRLNGTGGTAYNLNSGSWAYAPQGSFTTSFSTRRFMLLLNGTTDYVELVAYANPYGATTATGAMAATFSAKYVGQ